LNYIKNIK